MNKVFITGVNGFIGRNLAIALLARGDAVYGCDCRGPAPDGVKYRSIDILDEAGLQAWMGEVRPSHVFHMAARTDLLGKSMEDYAANTRGVEIVARVCASLPSVRRVIFASSRMVCRIDHIPEAYDEYSPPNFYGKSKVEGELIVRKLKSPFEWVMVRPTSIWGPGFGIPYRNFFDQVRARRYFHQKGHNPGKSFGYVGNTVFQLIALLSASASDVDRRTFYLGDYEPVKVRDWANFIHECFGLPGHIPTLPMSLLWIAAKAGDVINAVVRRDRAPLTSFRLRNLTCNMVYPQLSELAAITGALPYDWRQGTRETVLWLRKN